MIDNEVNGFFYLNNAFAAMELNDQNLLARYNKTETFYNDRENKIFKQPKVKR